MFLQSLYIWPYILQLEQYNTLSNYLFYYFYHTVVKVVDHLPVLRGRETPTIAIITALYCEKLAVDAMMEHKVSYVKYKTEGKSSNPCITLLLKLYIRSR